MSRLSIWCDIVCSECARTTSGRFTSGQVPKRKMCADARREGWLFQLGGLAFCGEECADRYKKNLASIRNVEQNARTSRDGDGST